ncbi:solute carrier family 45 member 4-like isoform X2 [Myripristis murdjan]|uniref:solute carrier family 45 member 4-like isoform X2 n=1 Tax=Myripristis murdjan TaxID=586833 RepID=UPI0011761DF3|nr:solute carrier family 45 member 4-like isoform X2 [Myripristis murdjan]
MGEEEEVVEGGEAPGLPEKKKPREREEENGDENKEEEEGKGERIPLRRWIMHGAVMFGREFCYAMETALVTPVLLQIGLPEQYYSLTWFLSPILGLIFTPLIGSASDRCTLRWGRRRPFILALCVGVLLGVALFLNGSLIGLSVGDTPNSQPIGIVLTVVGVVVLDFCADASEGPIRAYLLDVADTEEQDLALNIHAFSAAPCGTSPPADGIVDLEPRSMFSPQPKEHKDGPPPPLVQISPSTENTLLNTQVQQAKAVNGVKVGVSSSGHSHPVKGHASTRPGNRLSSTANSSRPHPHTFYRQPSFTFSYYGRVGSQRHRLRRPTVGHLPITSSRSLNDLCDLQRRADRRELQLSASSLSSEASSSEEGPEGGTTVRLLWLSMLKMPKQLWRLCVCHLLTWFSIIAEAVFYTDFMGQVIYHGDPTAPSNSTELQNYHKGVQMGCWGLVVYAATAAVCSALLQKYLDNFDLSIKVIYIVGTLGFSIGTAVMAIFPNVYVAMVMISSMGIISMSISYCPYALLGQYHEIKEYIQHSPANSRRGFGIDCAILSCQVYISQILVASALGAVVEAVGSVRVIPMVASGGSFLGFLTALFLVIYPEGEPSGSQQDQRLVGLPGEAGLRGERTNQGPALLRLTDRESFTNTEYQTVV